MLSLLLIHASLCFADCRDTAGIVINSMRVLTVANAVITFVAFIESLLLDICYVDMSTCTKYTSDCISTDGYAMVSNRLFEQYSCVKALFYVSNNSHWWADTSYSEVPMTLIPMILVFMLNDGRGIDIGVLYNVRFLLTAKWNFI